MRVLFPRGLPLMRFFPALGGVAAGTKALPIARIKELSPLPYRYNVIHYTGRPSAGVAFGIHLNKS